MYLKEENCSKLFQPTFSWIGTRGTAHTRAQRPAQELSLPCEKNHVGKESRKKKESRRKFTFCDMTAAHSHPHPEEPRNRNSFFSPCRGDGPRATPDRLCPLSPGSTISYPSTWRGCGAQQHPVTTCTPLLKAVWGVFRYTGLPRWESKQKHVNLVQLRDSMNGQWKNSQAQP